MSIMVGTGRGAQAGVLIRNAEALETMEKVDTVVVDKTGTLTEGKPRLVSVVAADGVTEAEVLALAAGLERGSEHPLACGRARRRGRSARRAAGRGRGLPLAHRAGRGRRRGGPPRGARQPAPARRARRRPPGRSGPAPRPCAPRARPWCSWSWTSRVAGLLGVADPIKASTPEAIRALQAEGLQVVMLTGDSRVTAQAVARTLGLDEVIAEVLPEQKAEVIRRLQGEGHIVAMAGDGVNDAPALAQAQVGIAMGTGTDVAMESAGITLVKGDLRGIVRARRLSRARRCATSARTWSGRSSTTCSACPSPRACCTRRSGSS